MLSSFSLSHEEVVARRLLISKKNPEEVSIFSAFSNISSDQRTTVAHWSVHAPSSNVAWARIPGATQYSGTPPYDHPVYKTTLLLRPYSFKPNVKTIESFYYFEDPVNATTSLLRPGFYGPTVVALTGFHCTWVELVVRFLPADSFLVVCHYLSLVAGGV